MSSPKSGASASETAQEWLVIVYRVPTDPTRLRAAVWRRLKGLGAVYLQNSVAALPASTSAQRSLTKLRRDIIDMGGSALLLAAEALQGESEIRQIFVSARDDEYGEIIDKCDDFLAGIQKEFDSSHFSFAELEENEVDYHKLASWLARVVERDAFGAPERTNAEDALRNCERELERYAARVYAEESDAH